jgi:radical SAM superfamily enzyme YgiQ (UPF0313 family)
MGIEKGHVSQLQQLRKRLSPEIARIACERVTSTGIRAAGTFILGGVGETQADVIDTIEFAVSLPLDYAHFNPLAIYPGTALFNQAFPTERSDRWLHLCLNEDLAPLGDILYRSTELPLEVILEKVQDAYRAFYTEERLSRVLTRLPRDEHENTNMSYRLLAEDRARSWTDRSDLSAPNLPADPGIPC